MAKTRNARKGNLKTISIIIVLIIIIGVAAGIYMTKQQSKTEKQGNAGKTGTVRIYGAGSSFLAPQLQTWIVGFQKEYPNITVNYASVGSGAGVAQFLKKVVDFAGTDPPLPEDKWQHYNGSVVQMPVILGAIVISYNLPGIDQPLNLTGKILANIYLGKIKYWDDPQIQQVNPGIKLPHKEIVAVHRSDSSGSTNIFTLFLHKSDPTDWPSEMVGKTIDWPVDKTGRGLGGKGNEGVTSIIKNTPYSIGYIEYSYALKEELPIARIQNRDGNFVLPSNDTIKAAALGALKYLPSSPLGDFNAAFNAIVYAPGPQSYPLTSFSFMVFWTKYPKDKYNAIILFIKYINTEGRKHVIKGYVAIPDQIANLNLKSLNIIKES